MVSQREIEVPLLEEREIYQAGKNIRAPLPYQGEANTTQRVDKDLEENGSRWYPMEVQRPPTYAAIPVFHPAQDLDQLDTHMEKNEPQPLSHSNSPLRDCSDLILKDIIDPLIDRRVKVPLPTLPSPPPIIFQPPEKRFFYNHREGKI